MASYKNELSIFGDEGMLEDFYLKNTEDGCLNFQKMVPEPILKGLDIDDALASFEESGIWRQQNWGSRFQPEMTDDVSRENYRHLYRFNTNGAPAAWAQKVSLIYPDLSFCLLYRVDSGVAGIFIIKNGEIIDRSTGSIERYG